MRFVFDEKFDRRKALVSASILAFVFGAFTIASFQLGIFFAPILAGLHASVILFERGKKRIMTFLIPAVLIIAEFIFCGVYSPNCLMALMISLGIYFTFTRSFFNKSEGAFILTVLVSSFIVLLFFLAAFYFNESFDVELAKQYFQAVLDDSRSDFVDRMMETINSSGSSTQSGMLNALTEEDILALYGEFERSLLALVMIIGFTIVGMGYKVFGRYVFRYGSNKEELITWRFTPAGVITAVYIILFLVNLFTSGKTDLFSVGINNLYLFLSFAYAYVGFGFAKAYLSYRFGNGKASIIVVIAILFLNVFAVNLLSALGVLFSIMAVKYENHLQNGGQGDGKL